MNASIDLTVARLFDGEKIRESPTFNRPAVTLPAIMRRA